MSTTNKREPIDLPSEMLQAITDSQIMGGETLMQLRQTCRTLDNATFDRFAKDNFSEIQCFISNEVRWKQLKAILSSARVAKRVKTVTFTTDYLEGTLFTSLQTACHKRWGDTTLYSFNCEQKDAYRALYANGIRQTVPIALMSNVLISLKNSHRHIAIHVKLSEYSNSPAVLDHVVPTTDITLRHSNLLSMMAVTGVPLTGLTLSPSCTTGMETHFDYIKPGLLSCTATLGEMRFGSYSSINSYSHEDIDYDYDFRRLDFVAELIASAKNIRNLHLNMKYFELFDDEIVPSTKLLLAHRSSNLTTLSLEHMTITEKDLLGILARNEQLEEVGCYFVQLDYEGLGWLAVFRSLRTREKLRLLKLVYLGTVDGELTAILPQIEDGNWEDKAAIKFKGEEEVARGLERLAVGPLKHVRY